MKKFLTRALIAILVLVIGWILFVSYAKYSDGVRSGVVVKISKKGVLFKTAEGQLNLQSFGAVKRDSNQLSEVFEFSVESDADDVYKALEEVSLTGERVSLHYVQRYAGLPWKGDTKIFVEKVVRSPDPEKSSQREEPFSH